jgi:hypothetical protein
VGVRRWGTTSSASGRMRPEQEKTVSSRILEGRVTLVACKVSHIEIYFSNSSRDAL